MGKIARTYNFIVLKYEESTGEFSQDTSLVSNAHLINDLYSENSDLLAEKEENKNLPAYMNLNLLSQLDSEANSKLKLKEIQNEILFLVTSFLKLRLSTLKSAEKNITQKNIYYCRFIELLENDQIYKNGDLSLDLVASLFDINKCYLSKIINSASNRKFTEIVNAYRVQDVIRAIEAGKHKRYTLLSLAYDAGFTSKASFNASFKRITKLTPTQYINQMV